ncbi:MAG: hypothetical protein IJ300_06940 [Clostridia bacterium]|nr:hypothetical protein [Clostridia bacterium]
MDAIKGFENMVNRADKVAFAKMVSDEGTTYQRLRGFSELSESKNPTEYSRKYVDEKNERSEVTGYAPEISFDFDEYSENTIQAEIVKVFDQELIGKATLIEIVVVNLAKETEAKGTYEASCRAFSIIPDTSGGETDRMNYSGSFKAYGDTEKGSATTTDAWETATFTPEAAE